MTPARRPAPWSALAPDPLAAWALAAALFLLGLALLLEADGAGRAYPFLGLFPAVLLTAWLSGRTPGIAVAVCSAAAAWWFEIRTPGLLVPPAATQLAALALFLAVSLFAVFLVTGLARGAALARREQEQASAALVAQRMLSAELRHRVANNLQVVSSALTLQARRLGGTATAAALGEATRRLDALGRLHRMLVDAEPAPDVARVLGEIARTQVDAAGDGRVALAIDVPAALPLDAERLTLLGMIVSEAVSNALKHGLDAEGRGRLSVRLGEVPGARLMLEVRDAGAGLPDAFDLRTADSLGLRIVQSLARRLDGTLALASERGTVLRVTFPAVAPGA